VGQGAGPTQGHLDARGLRFAIVGSRWNGAMADRLVEAALDCLRRHGADPGDLAVVRVPGAWEVPVAARRMAGSGRVDALVCTGVIIRGATPHFDLLAAEVTRSLGAVQRDTGIPLGYGIVTADTVEQALERSGSKAGNKGWEAAMAALEMADLLRRLEA